MKLLSLSVFVGLSAVMIAGCGPRDYYLKTETGPHGVVTSKKVYYTPEQIKSREELYAATTRPSDPKLAEVEDAWPKLTAEQRETIAKSIREMTGKSLPKIE